MSMLPSSLVQAIESPELAVFIQSNWSMTPGTQQVFESTRQEFLTSLPAGNAALLRKLQAKDLLKTATSTQLDVGTE
jgi:hypothetical protein